MYDKRSAWALGGIAPQRGERTQLSEIIAAAMTEIPTSKQWRADQFSATADGPIAGTAWNESTKPHLAIGPTGVCVRTLVNLVCK
jgi:hypothetical protein